MQTTGGGFDDTLRPVDANAWCTATTGGTRVNVVVQPRSSRESVGPVVGDRLKVSVHAPPTDDRANEAVARLIASTAGIAPSRVTVVAGRRSRRKTLLVEGLPPAVVAKRLLPV